MNAVLKRWIRRVILGLASILLVSVVVVSVIVERESDYVLESMGGSGDASALVLYHPSRDARFSDDLSLAVAKGFQEAGLLVERATITSETPSQLEGHSIVAVISNTYYWTPDLPTLRYLARARFNDVPVIGLIGGAGSTGRSQELLDEALRSTGALSVESRAFWLWRPNDDTRMGEPNRDVAIDLAEAFAYEAGLAAVR